MREKLDIVIEKYRQEEGNVISLLQDIQEEIGYIPEDAVAYVSKRVGIPESSFFGVATFYAQFYLKPRGKNIITACRGTACHVKGSERVISRIRRELELPDGEDTTEDGLFTVEDVACVGACSIAPVVIVNKEVHAKVSASKLLKEVNKLKKETDA
ncbi:MAG: NAD(P)H-dependent oxidoreductase subunit E [Thermodesulfovibrionia bacterium]|nr:NAD(P)H-dependent oxidoreductase subunit E [Thermodesulfovibrionia bacterium]